MSGALIGGTLNRIMIADLGMPASLVAIFFIVPMLVSPLRVWFGYRSDGYPIMGRRREPYIVLGALLIGLGIVAVSSLITQLSGPAALAAPFCLPLRSMVSAATSATTPFRPLSRTVSAAASVPALQPCTRLQHSSHGNGFRHNRQSA